MKKLLTLSLAIMASFSLWAESFYVVNGKCNVPLKAGMNSAKYQILKSNGTDVEATEDITSTITATASFYYNSTSCAYADLTNTSNYSSGSSDSRTIQSIKLQKDQRMIISFGDLAISKLDVIYMCGSQDPCSLKIDGDSVGTNNQNIQLFSKEGSFSDSIVIVNTSVKSKEYRLFVLLTETECNAPESALVLKSDIEGAIYAGDVVTFSTEGGNGNEVSIVGQNEESLSGNSWTATEGKHIFVASQAVTESNICAQEAQLELNVITRNPVTAVSIEGDAAGYAGDEYIFIATAANAAEYKWFVNNAEQSGAVSAEFTFTPNAEGTYNIVCKARNEFNQANEWIESNTIAFEASKKVVVYEDIYIWKKGSGYTGCIENPNVNPNAQQAVTELANSTATFTGMNQMGRAADNNTEVSLKFTAKEGLYIQSICTYGKLEEPAGADILWNNNSSHIDAYTESQKEFEAPAGTYPKSFEIKFLGVSKDSGGLWWRNALVTLGEAPSETAIEHTKAATKAVKIIREGQILIVREGKTYTVMGTLVK